VVVVGEAFACAVCALETAAGGVTEAAADAGKIAGLGLAPLEAFECFSGAAGVDGCEGEFADE
jgi:hypothetical protein